MRPCFFEAFVGIVKFNAFYTIKKLMKSGRKSRFDIEYVAVIVNFSRIASVRFK